MGMKILHIGNIKSGIDTYVRKTIEFSESNIQYVIITGEDDHCAPFFKDGKKIHTYQICMFRNINPYKDLKALFQGIKIIRREKPNLIQCHSAKGGMIGRLAAFLTHTKCCYTPHAFSFLSAEGKLKRNIFLFLERITRFNSFLLACADSERELGISLVHYKRSKAFAWQNSISDISSHDFILPDPASVPENYIISVGRPSFQKNPLKMVETISQVHQRYPDVHFMLVGVGYYSPLLEDMKQMINAYNLSSVIELIPWCSREQTLGYIKKAMIYLTTSRYEGLPIGVLEAMALGKPIIASNVLGNRDCVIDNYNGFLIHESSDDYSKKCCELLANQEKLKMMGLNSRSHFLESFLIDKKIKFLTEIYYKIVSK